MFIHKLMHWLNRPVSQRQVNKVGELAATVCTDIGLLRSENQDVIAAMLVNSSSNYGKPFFAMCLLDGMGGMSDGRTCANIGLSTFFYSLVKFRNEKLRKRIELSISDANNEIYRHAQGKGGATISAILIESGSSPISVNVGDSRIYTYSKTTGLAAFSQDDSLEALGGEGRGLIQFLGIGDPIRPHIVEIPENYDDVILTSDGVHFITHNAFEELANHAQSQLIFCERISEYVRWCGAHDNASLGILNPYDVARALDSHKSVGIEIWDSHGDLNIMWMKENPEMNPTPLQNYQKENRPLSDLDTKPISEIDNTNNKIQGELFTNKTEVKKNISKPRKRSKPKESKSKNIDNNKDNDSSVVINVSGEELL